MTYSIIHHNSYVKEYNTFERRHYYDISISSSIAGCLRACYCRGVRYQKGTPCILQRMAMLQSMEKTWENIICLQVLQKKQSRLSRPMGILIFGLGSRISKKFPKMMMIARHNLIPYNGNLVMIFIKHNKK